MNLPSCEQKGFRAAQRATRGQRIIGRARRRRNTTDAPAGAVLVCARPLCYRLAG